MGGFFDVNDPNSVLNVAPFEVRDLLKQVPEEWLQMSESQLEMFCEPCAYTGRIRACFWAEYEHSRVRAEPMVFARIAVMMGVPQGHLKPYFKSTKKCAWILSAPSSYETSLDEALNFGMRRLRNDILEIPIRDSDGKIDHKAAELFLKAVAFIDMRRNGGIVNKNININTTPKEMREVGAELTLQEINRRIAELETQGQIDAAQRSLPENTVIEIPSVRTDKEALESLSVPAKAHKDDE